MREIILGNIPASVIAMGCMRIAEKTVKETDALVRTALEGGITLFDHADIYGGGKSEELFGRVLSAEPGLRDRMVIQSKCGIRKGFYDFSRDHILAAVEGSLRRLQTDHLDLLLFHRPDALAEREEFSDAVRRLKESGKVLAFGVSNMNAAQVELLESWTGETMAADQLQLSLMHADPVASGINVNVEPASDSILLPYARRRNMAIQAWSPLQYGMFGGCFLGDEKFPELNRALSALAEQYRVTPAAVALSWILRIPGKTQVILGTADCRHMADALKAAEIRLTREQWYGLYRAAGYSLP